MMEQKGGTGWLKKQEMAKFNTPGTNHSIRKIGKLRKSIKLTCRFYDGSRAVNEYSVDETIETIILKAGVYYSPYMAWFDNMNLEPHATPLGVGMEGGETIDVIKLSEPDLVNRFELPVSLRVNQDIDFGLNFFMEDPLPIIYSADLLRHDNHLSEEAALACKEQLECITNALFPAFDMTISTFPLSLPKHLPDFTKIKGKLRKNTYQHSADCMHDVYDQLARYENAAIIYSKSKCWEEGRLRLMLKKDLGKTLQEFQQALQSYREEAGDEARTGFDSFWNSSARADNKFMNVLIYIGPVRDFNEQTCISSPPSMVLAGLTQKTRLSHLVDSYNFHLDGNFAPLPSTAFCLRSRTHDGQLTTDNGHLTQTDSCAHTDLDALVLDVIPPLIQSSDWDRFYFAFHVPHVAVPAEDSRDINALVDFIESPSEPGGGRHSKKGKRMQVTVHKMYFRSTGTLPYN